MGHPDVRDEVVLACRFQAPETLVPCGLMGQCCPALLRRWCCTGCCSCVRRTRKPRGAVARNRHGGHRIGSAAGGPRPTRSLGARALARCLCLGGQRSRAQRRWHRSGSCCRLDQQYLAADAGHPLTVATLAHLETDPDFDLGLFIGLNDEWSGGWGRLDADLAQAAKQELGRLLHGDDHGAPPTH